MKENQIKLKLEYTDYNQSVKLEKTVTIHGYGINHELEELQAAARELAFAAGYHPNTIAEYMSAD